MHISWNTSPSGLNLNTGYGIAGFGIVTSLQRLGHKVTYKDPDAPVEVSFCMPDASPWSNDFAYHIYLTPWESTELKPGWLECFNTADEVWATSPWVAGVYKDQGVIPPIKVYPHGISHDWEAHRRRRGSVIKFLHCGEPAPRKGGQMALEAFREVFQDRDDVHLTIKAQNSSSIRVYDRRRQSIVGVPHELYKNVTSVFNDCTEAEMIHIFKQHHVLVYPSWGEGFGIIPLQAMATGMPTITTTEWACYSHLVLPELSLDSTLVDSPWIQMHPGKLFEPDYDDLLSAYAYTAKHFDKLAGIAFRNSFKVHQEFDWDTRTAAAFEHIVAKFS